MTKIEQKQDELITLLYKVCNKYEIGDWTKIEKVKDELAQLKAEAENIKIIKEILPHTFTSKAEKEVSDEGDEFIEGLLSKIDKQIKKVKSLPSEKDVEDENDFVQYVTNLLYNAYADGKQQINPDVFDEWIEKEMVNMGEFYASHNLLAGKVSDADIEKEIREYFNSSFLKLSDIVISDMVRGAKFYRDNLIKKG